MPTLSHEAMETQLSQIDLLMAMYPSPEELLLDSPTKQLISDLQQYCNQEQPAPSSLPDSISVELNISIGAETSETYTIPLTIIIPLKNTTSDSSEVPPLNLRVRQPNWLSKAQLASLTSKMPTDDVLSTIDYIREAALKYTNSTTDQSLPNPTTDNFFTPLARVWFYFPSLSTREKRNDLVNHAPSYGLTGFVLAGKPGVLCLEGMSSEVDAYMKFIKTESWGDIPAHQKKVSERYRESGSDVKRVFEDMQEITDLLGEKRGERANRGDMKALETWLNERGLGAAFEKVLM